MADEVRSGLRHLPRARSPAGDRHSGGAARLGLDSLARSYPGGVNFRFWVPNESPPRD